MLPVGRTIKLVVVLLLIASTTAERWSRQVSSQTLSPETINDWIPLTDPCPTCRHNDRSANGRVLNFPQNQFGFTSPATAPQAQPLLSVGQPFQFPRFVQQSQAQQLPKQTNKHPQVSQHESPPPPAPQKQQHTSQSFFQFEMPVYQPPGSRQEAAPSIQTGYQIQHSLANNHQSLATSPLFSHKPVFPSDFHPQLQPQQQKLVQNKNVQQNLVTFKQHGKDRPLETKPTGAAENYNIQTPLQYQAVPLFHNHEPTAFQSQLQYQPQLQYQRPTAPGGQDEEIQLLYVPYDTLLQHQNQQGNYQNAKFNVAQHPVNPAQINSFYTPEPITTPGPISSTSLPSSTYRPSTSHQPVTHNHFPPTHKPKPKPHQPPLAMFALNRKDLNAEASLNDVLVALKNADAISVIDTPTTKRVPPVFIGPFGLPAPSGYTKFELPYLSSLNKKNHLDDVPFFVAPLSYRVPAGFMKIPLPEPHVGSIVVNTPYETNFIQGFEQITQNPEDQFTPSPVPHDLQQTYHRQQQQQQQQQQQEEQSRLEHLERVRQQEKQEQLRLERQKEEQLRLQREKEEAIRLQQQKEEEVRLQQQREEEFRLQQQREEEVRLQQQREEELRLQRQKEEELRVQREREEAIRQQREKEEQNKLEREKEERIREHKRKEEQIIQQQLEEQQHQQQQEEDLRIRQEIRHHNHRYNQPHNTKQMYITPITDNVVRYRTTTRIPSSHAPIRHSYRFGTNVGPQQTDFYRDQFGQEVTSLRPSSMRPQHADRVRPIYHKRPEDAPRSTPRPYANFKPMPHNVVNEEYFNALKVQPIISSPSTTPESTPDYVSSSTPYVSSTTESEPSSENIQTTDPYVEVQPSISQTYQEVSSPAPQQVLSIDNYTLRPAIPEYATSTSEEEQTVKNRHRGHEPFKNHRIPSTTSRPQYENVRYTPVSVDVEGQFYNIPHSTQPYYDGSTLRTTTPRNRVTYYTPSGPIEQEQPTANTILRDDVVHYSHSGPGQTHIGQQVSEYPTKESPTRDNEGSTSTTERLRPPQGHLNTNEIHDDKHNDSDQDIEYDPNPYQLPSELPPLTPNLPGLVNNLQEKDKLNAIDQEGSTEPQTTTTSTTLRPTRRPIHRSRRPTLTRTSTSVSYSTSVDSSTRRTVQRGRRPYNQQKDSPSTVAPLTTTTRRSSVVRNPNRVRYTPTAEERQRYRSRTRGTSTSSKKSSKNEDNTLEYQRDVLKQNYPVFRPRSSTTRTTTPPPTTTTEKDIDTTELNTINSQDTNSNQKDLFPGLLEPMQIAQEYHQSVQDNYGPGYFPNEEIIGTESPYAKNEVHPVYATSTEAVRETPTKRPSFVRRLSRPTRTTTEQPDIPTTTGMPEEKFTVRPKTRPTSARPKVVKIRGRIRKPHPASTTTTTAATNHGTQSVESYNQLKRFNQDFYQDNYSDESSNNPRSRSRFSLEPQESQWSPSLTSGGSFVPIDPNSKAKLLRDTDEFENEQEIVTAGPIPNNSNTFLFNVSAGFGPTAENSKTGQPSIENASYKELDDSKALNGKTLETINGDNQVNSKRRGYWKRVRVRPSENFEAAESQNIGKQLYNRVLTNEKEFGTKLSNGTTEEMKGIKVDIQTTTEYSDMEDTVTSSTPHEYEYDQELYYGGVSTTEPDYDMTTIPPVDTIGRIKNAPTTAESEFPAYESKSEHNDTDPTQNSPSNDNQSDVTTEVSMEDMTTDVQSINRRRDEEEDDLETQPSIFDEVKKQLTHLFAIEDDQEDDYKPFPRRQEYTSIHRIRTSSESTEPKIPEPLVNKQSTTEVSPFHKNLMGSVVYATSTSTEVSHETEICYRGRCIKSTKPL